MSQHRHTITVPIVLTDQPALQRCVDDASYRVMVFCSGEPTGVQDVAFPHQSELRVNGGEIKANLRGLKNKPGSTRPVDITGALRLRPTYINRVEFTYALTQKVSLPESAHRLAQANTVVCRSTFWRPISARRHRSLSLLA